MIRSRDIKTIHKSPNGRFEVVYLKPLKEYHIWDALKKTGLDTKTKSKDEAITLCDKLEIFTGIIMGDKRV